MNVPRVRDPVELDVPLGKLERGLRTSRSRRPTWRRRRQRVHGPCAGVAAAVEHIDVPSRASRVASLFSRWSRKNPVFCPSSTSTRNLQPVLLDLDRGVRAPENNRFSIGSPSNCRIGESLRSTMFVGLRSSVRTSRMSSSRRSIPAVSDWTASVSP